MQDQIEDRVEIARDFHNLNARRGVLHTLSNQLLASGIVCEEKQGMLQNLNLQARAFYTFFNHLYEWYIGKEEDHSSTHFWVPFKANPFLAVSYEDGREERRQEEYRKEAIFWEESEMAACFNGSRWKIIPPENPNELFASSFPRETVFYLGHVLSSGVWAALQEPKQQYARLIEEILQENKVLTQFIHDEKYVKAILEKQPIGPRIKKKI